MTQNEKNDAAMAVEHILAIAGLTLTDEERDFFVRTYPRLQEALTALRIPEARYAEPMLIYPADNRR